MTGKIITALTKIEAETHWSKGRLKEAMDIYTKLLNSSPNMTMNTKIAIEARIKLLRDELERPAGQQKDQDIEIAIKKLQAAMAVDESLVNLRRRVVDYYKRGRYADALESLKQLIQRNAADERCINAVAVCLARLHTIEELPVAVDLFLSESFQNAEKASQFKLLLAEKMAQKGLHRHAEVLHRHGDRFSSSTL
jgi:tetratricopeptide (TPR) repeat protein